MVRKRFCFVLVVLLAASLSCSLPAGPGPAATETALSTPPTEGPATETPTPAPTDTVPPEPPTATLTPAPMSSPSSTPTSTPSPTAVPVTGLAPGELDQLIELHEYSPAIVQAAGLGSDAGFPSLSAVDYSPDGRFLAVGGCTSSLHGGDSGRGYCGSADDPSDDSSARTYLVILDANTEDLVAVLPETEADTTITDVAFTHAGDRLFYTLHHSKSDSRLFVWEMSAQEAEPYQWAGPGYPSIDISPDDRWLALDNLLLDDTTGRVSVWDLTSGQLARELPAGYYRPQFSSDGTKLAVAPYQQSVVYDTGTWEEVAFIELPCARCYFALSPDLSLLATSDADQVGAPVIISDIATGQQVQSLPAGDVPTSMLVFTPDGSMFWNIMEDAQTVVWDADTWESFGSMDFLGSAVFLLGGSGYTLVDIQFAADGQSFLALTWFHTFLVGLP